MAWGVSKGGGRGCSRCCQIQPREYLLLNHALGWFGPVPGRQRPTHCAARAWLGGSRHVMTRTHCQGDARAVKGSTQREADTPRGMLQFFVHPCLSMAPGKIEDPQNQRVARISVLTSNGRTKKRRETGMARGEETNRDRGKPVQLVGERLNSRDGVLPWDAARRELHPRLQGWAHLHLPTAVDELCCLQRESSGSRECCLATDLARAQSRMLLAD